MDTSVEEVKYGRGRSLKLSMQIVQKARAAPGPWDTQQPSMPSGFALRVSSQVCLTGGEKIWREIHAQLCELRPLETKNNVM